MRDYKGISGLGIMMGCKGLGIIMDYQGLVLK